VTNRLVGVLAQRNRLRRSTRRAGAFTLVSLLGPWGWSLFGVVWGLALAGIGLRLVLRRTPTGPFVALYLAMGWCVVVAAKPLLAALVTGGIALLAAGGVAYSAGIVFYA
jgi:hemolysin III